jgi:ribonuclease J
MIKTSPKGNNPQLIVHRSTNQIGGNCIEITWQEHRLILDAGSPLDQPETDADVVPTSLDVTRPVDGVIFSHPHQAHYGLLQPKVGDCRACRRFKAAVAAL